jgi:hypothetical protein
LDWERGSQKNGHRYQSKKRKGGKKKERRTKHFITEADSDDDDDSGEILEMERDETITSEESAALPFRFQLVAQCRIPPRQQANRF